MAMKEVPLYEVGEKVFVRKGLRDLIMEQKVSNQFSYIPDHMDRYAEEGKILTIACVLEGYKGFGYKVTGCERDYTYNEEWLLPLAKTNGEAVILLRDTL